MAVLLDQIRKVAALVLFVGFSVVLANRNAAAQSYAASDLYTLAAPAGFPDPSGLSGFGPASAAGGQVAGSSLFQPNFAGGDALLWTGPSGALTTLSPTGFDRSFVTATNGSQQVGAGEPFSVLTHALLWSGTDTSAIDLQPTNLQGFMSSIAYGIGGGQQVGNGFFGPNSKHALLWNGNASSAVDLHPTTFIGFDSSVANGTDGIHQVGATWNSNIVYTPHAMLWSGTAASAVDLNPTNLLRFEQSTAYAVSGTQQVGDGMGSATGDLLHALFWNGTANSAVDLHPTRFTGFDTSHANGTNGVHQVGYVANSISGNQDAALWTGTAASAIDLAQLLPFPSTFSSAYTIDAQGNVWGSATDSAGAIHAVEWSPVPEPTALTLFAAGALGLLGFRGNIRQAANIPGAAEKGGGKGDIRLFHKNRNDPFSSPSMLDAFAVDDNFASYRRDHYLTSEDLLWIGDANNDTFITDSDINAMEQYLAGHGGYGT
jgi:hypothetical protein